MTGTRLRRRQRMYMNRSLEIDGMVKISAFSLSILRFHRRSSGMDTCNFIDMVKMGIGTDYMPDVMIQHSGGMDGVSDRDSILIQERQRLLNIFMGNRKNRICDIFQKVTRLMGQVFLPNRIVSIEYLLEYFGVGADTDFGRAYLLKDPHARGLLRMGSAEDIHDDIAVKEAEAHFLWPALIFEYSFSHFPQSSGAGVGDSVASFRSESMAPFLRLICSSLRYVSSTASRIRVPSFLCLFSANSSRVLYCSSVKRTWARWVYFMKKYYHENSIESIVSYGYC